MSTNHPLAKPCFLNGCLLEFRADGSTTCTVCGLWSRPNPEQVNALLRAGAGGREYRKLAAQVLNQARLGELPKAPPLTLPDAPPPVYLGSDGSSLLPSIWLVLPICFFAGAALGLALYSIWSHM